MPMVIQSGSPAAAERCLDVLGQAVMFSEVGFRAAIAPAVRYTGRLLVHGKGWLNALKFSTVTYMTDDILLGPTASFTPPIYMPVHEMMVNPGDVITVEVAYEMGGGLAGLKANVSSLYLPIATVNCWATCSSSLTAVARSLPPAVPARVYVSW